MRKFKQAFRAFLAVTFAVGLSVQAGAQNTNLDELGALLVLPYITGGFPAQPNPWNAERRVIPNQTAITLATITNASAESILIEIDFINGDPGEDWGSTSRGCELTASETTTAVFVRSGGNSRVYMECSRNGDLNDSFDDINLALNGANGVMVVAVADETGPLAPPTITPTNVLVGDAVVVDLTGGQAYSFGAIPFQKGMTNPAGASDKLYKFDGNEYAHFPAALTTNFITPVSGVINAELILFTLDGLLNQSNVTPTARIGGNAFDDDEQPFDFQYEFDCFDIVSLTDVNPAINNDVAGADLGTLSGHLELVVQSTGTGNDAHDDTPGVGDGNDSRKRAVHGWIIQNIVATPPPAVLVRAGQPTAATPLQQVTAAGRAAWGRPLSQGTTALVPEGGDTVALDAR